MLGYIDTIDNFMNTPSLDVLNYLKSIYPDAGKSQQISWEVLIDDLKRSLAPAPILGAALIAIEYSLNVEDMSADAIILGKSNSGKNFLFVIESKQWGDEYILDHSFSSYSSRDSDVLLHPQSQVHRHMLALKNYIKFEIAPDEISPFVYIKNATDIGCKQLLLVNSDTLTRSIPVSNNLSKIIEHIASIVKLPSDLTPDMLRKAQYYPSHAIIDAMEAIVTKEAPFILTSEQEQAVADIQNAIKNGKRIIRISGSAGSGKTAILLNLYVKILKKGAHTPYFVSGAQNTALYRSLYPAVSLSFNYSYTIKSSILGSSTLRPVVLMDEAQHNSRGIISDILSSTNAILILCYDEWQIINANNSMDELDVLSKRKDYAEVVLHSSVRFNGSQLFDSNVKSFLSGSSVLPDSLFEFRIMDTLSDLKKHTLSTISSHPECTAAIIGLLSDDDHEMADSSDGFFFVNWGSKKETEWIPYVKDRDYLSRFDGSLWAGTWWLPGIDVDYSIVIAGDDVMLTDDGVFGIPHHSKNYRMIIGIAEEMLLPDYLFESKSNAIAVSNILEYLDKPSNIDIKKEFSDRFSFYIRNMYYIMMTRGQRGCFVYFKNRAI